MNPSGTFRRAALPAHSHLRGLDLPRLARRWPGQILRAAPIFREGDFFQVHPAGKRAPAKAWHWIVPVRHTPAPPINASASLHSFIGTPAFAEVRDLFRRIDALDECLFGEIIDLVAVARDLSRPRARLCGTSPVLGCQDYPEYESIRVFSTVGAWLASGCRGVVMVGDDAENLRFLGQFDNVVADDLSHGEQLHAALRRAYAGPSVRVAA